METEPVRGDAFGEILRSCWAQAGEPGTAYEVIERDDGFVGVGDASRYFATPEQWSPPERRACDRARGRVLDVGCGAGRHAVVLKAAGFDVVGLDPSPGAVAVAHDRGIKAHLGTATRSGDGLGDFDTILMLGNNLGLLASRQQAPIVLTALARLARPGARLYGSCMDPYTSQAPEHLAYHERNRTQGRMPGQLRMRVRHKSLATDWFNYLLLSPDELAELVDGTPWTITEIITDPPNYLAELTSATARP